MIPNRQIIMFSPPCGALRPGTLDVLRPQPPQSYLLLSKYESSYFHTWLHSHQKPTRDHPSSVSKSSSLIQPTSQRCPHTLSPNCCMSHPHGYKILLCHYKTQTTLGLVYVDGLRMWEPLPRKSGIYFLLLHSLKSQSENHDAAYTPQAYDSDNIFKIISYPHRCTYYIHHSWNSCTFVVFPIICQSLCIYLTLEFALASQFPSNFES